jgi:Protein of unknown function (DUF2804)
MGSTLAPMSGRLATSPPVHRVDGIHRALPYRGAFGDARPPALSAISLPPAAMPGRQGLRPLKAWRYIGVYGPEVMMCMANARIGRARQTFWAVWDRASGQLHERTVIRRGSLVLDPGRARLIDGDVAIDLALEETPGVETICSSGDSYAWTRKQGGVRATGTIEIAGRRRALVAPAVIDDTAAYYPRRTRWRWSAGLGRAVDGRAVAWNLVSGVNDPPVRSERTVWIDREPLEVPPCTFAEDLSWVDHLRFRAEAVRERNENLLILRSVYRQPFGTFSGVLPGGIELAEGYGVMEAHEAWW